VVTAAIINSNYFFMNKFQKLDRAEMKLVLGGDAPINIIGDGGPCTDECSDVMPCGMEETCEDSSSGECYPARKVCVLP
jgi:hypothetical protein